MAIKATLANTLWYTTAWPAAKRFQRALLRPETAQATLLRRYLAQNAETDYGRRFDFAKIHSCADYQHRVPLTTYDDYAADIARIGNGESNILTTEPVQLFEPSSGSTAASKLIPYTATLKAEFQRAIAPWIVDLFNHDRNLMRGPAYWSITPLTQGKRTTAAGIPIGFEEDSAYLGPLAGVVNALMAVPNVVKQINDIESFRYVTLLCLLRQADLRLISVWNPTYLTLLLKPLAGWWEQLLQDIATGAVTPPQPLSPHLVQSPQLQFRSLPQRTAALAQVEPADYTAIWPQLRLLSCWTDGPSAPYAEQLSPLFPQATLQGKGLLATEAFVSLPLVGIDGAPLAITAHFFEFLAENGRTCLAHELQIDQIYSVIVTTGGGFYRYQLQDRVLVVGFVGATPSLRFVGKADRVVDFFGEKLSEPFVAATITALMAEHAIRPHFVMLAPQSEQDGQPLHYVLYLECDPSLAALPLARLRQELEHALCANYHYAYCRQLGQLGAVQVVQVYNGAECYLRGCRARGQKLGDIKPTLLDSGTTWAAWLAVADEPRETEPLQGIRDN